MRDKHFKSIIQDGLSRYDCLDNNVLYLLEYLILIDAQPIQFFPEPSEGPLRADVAIKLRRVIILNECLLVELINGVVSQVHVPIVSGVASGLPVLACREPC